MPGLAFSNAATASWVSFSRLSLPHVLMRSATWLPPDPPPSSPWPAVPGAQPAASSTRQTMMVIGRISRRSVMAVSSGDPFNLTPPLDLETVGVESGHQRGDVIGSQPTGKVGVERVARHQLGPPDPGAEQRGGIHSADEFQRASGAAQGGLMNASGKQVVDQTGDLGGVVARYVDAGAGGPDIVRTVRHLWRGIAQCTGGAACARVFAEVRRHQRLRHRDERPVRVAVPVHVVDLQRAGSGVDPDPAELAW